MPGHPIRWITSLVLASLFLGACNLPLRPTPAASSQPNAAYTAAAETIVAQLTEISNPSTATPSLGTQMPTIFSPTLPILDTTPSPPATQMPSPEATQTSTPEVTASETPAASAVPTETTVSTDPRLNLGDPTWKDTFADITNWPLYNDEHVEMEIKNGRLVMTALHADKWDSWMLSWPVIQDFYLEVTAQPQDCSGLDHYGLLARSPDTVKAYLFGFSCDGEYSLRKWDRKKFTKLVDWTTSPFIVTGSGQTNRLGFKAEGDKLTLYANGNPLTELNDDSYEQGSFGLFLGSVNTEKFTVRFTEVAYWELP